MTKEKLFAEMVVQITEMFEVKQIDYKTDNEKADGEIIGATMLFHSGLVVMMLTQNDKLQIGYGHIASAPYTQRMKNEKELLKSIWGSAYAVNEIIKKKTNDELVGKLVEEELTISYEDDGTINTNYWETEWNKEGFMYLTVGKNNVFHLLIPNSLEYVLDEMETGKYVVLTTGKTDRKKAMSIDTIPDNVEMVELMFEDNTESPFCTSLDIRQCTYKLGADFNRGKSTLKIYTENEEMESDLYIRSGKEYVLPCLKPIDTKEFINLKK